jgi:uncharacterized protein (DUF1501 family)
MANTAATHPKRRKSCILLWMSGGPSQLETFDLKPGHVNGGPFREIPTNVPGIRISEHLPKVAQYVDKMVLVRSMSTKEGDHTRGSHYLRTGFLPGGPVQYPPLPALVAKELGEESAALPSSVSISPFRQFSPAAYGSGFLGPNYAPLIVGETAPANGQGEAGVFFDQSLNVKNLDLAKGVTPSQRDARIALLETMQRDFLTTRPGLSAASNQSAYARAVRLMRSEAGKAFDLEAEPAALRDAYGRNQFGQGCLLARRLVERGVAFVEVALGGVNGERFVPFAWDCHFDIFKTVKSLSGTLDAGWSTLMMDLKARGMLDSTLIVWMGEFGRTPRMNQANGRDHYPNAWSTVLAGGGLKGGQVVGKTSADGSTVEERPVAVTDFLATICRGLGIDPLKENMSNVARPIRIVDKTAKPIEEVLV